MKHVGGQVARATARPIVLRSAGGCTDDKPVGDAVEIRAAADSRLAQASLKEISSTGQHVDQRAQMALDCV
ncbi:MAG: hypothetical protein QOH05_3627 [Acetobacteraceae bacterium]|jgi:hypothetical protein|nr:hypothetical protein [Acetobacteraceae bacterium]